MKTRPSDKVAIVARLQSARASAQAATARGESTTFWDERVDAALDELLALRARSVSGSVS